MNQKNLAKTFKKFERNTKIYIQLEAKAEHCFNQELGHDSHQFSFEVSGMVLKQGKLLKLACPYPDGRKTPPTSRTSQF